MRKFNIFLTGATGGMGSVTLRELLKETDKLNITILVLNTEQDRSIVKEYEKHKGLTIHWGDLTNYQDVYECVKGADLILHIAALVSPLADYHPQLAMKVNFGSMNHIIRAIKEQKRMEVVKLVSIGTVAETGDRRPPIHWGRVGDPIKPSIFDYYAVSKVAAERLLIEAGLTYWVSLRQTGMIGPAMAKIQDAIIFHNCLDNVLEYVSDHDSGILLRNLCIFDYSGALDKSFWGHIYNIGGGECCRVDTLSMFQNLFRAIGFRDLNYVIEPKWFATSNFHGQYYLDSDKLEEYLHFRHDSMQYFYDEYLKMLGLKAYVSRMVCQLPGGQRMIGTMIKKSFLHLIKSEHGTVRFTEQKMEEQIDVYWGSRENFDAIPYNFKNIEHFQDWDQVIVIDHGYDERKPERMLCLEDLKGAARFRGGDCISDDMITGDWVGKLSFTCAFGHSFKASPRLILEGGHWCPECERFSWNYATRAKVDLFFAQVWTPIHNAWEPEREYIKIVNELNYEDN